jgi:hypothetical protein
MELYESYMLQHGHGQGGSGQLPHLGRGEQRDGRVDEPDRRRLHRQGARELQTHITQNQPKMLVLNKQVMLSVDTNLDKPRPAG